MANTLDQMNIPFNDFQLNTVIDPEEFDQNFAEVQIKTNNAITQINTNSADIETLQTNETTNEARLTQAEADIDSLEVEDTANKARLTVNEADIDALETADTQNVKLTGNQTVAGKKTFSTSPAVPTPTATTDASTKGYVDSSVAGVVLGQIPDDSLTNSKMATDVKIGSLAALSTTDKSSVTNAISEVDANADAAQSAADTNATAITKVGITRVIDSQITAGSNTVNVPVAELTDEDKAEVFINFAGATPDGEISASFASGAGVTVNSTENETANVPFRVTVIIQGGGI